MSERVWRRLVVAVSLGALAVLFAVGCFVAWEFTVDDAYISLRYARHLADAHGLVWNRGEAPVEGFTNFLWVVFLSFGELWRLDSILLAKVLGIGAHAGTTALIALAVRRETGSLAASVLGAGGYLMFLPGYFHAVSAMETAFYGFLLTLMFVLGLGIVSRRPGAARWTPALPFLAIALGMTRPDGLLPAGWVMFLSLMSLAPRDQRRLMAATLAATVVGGLYMVWRVSYFGHLLPNTAYVKAGQLSSGLEWLRDTVLFLAPMVVLAVAPAASGKVEEDRKVAYFLGFLAMSLAVYAVSNPLMDYMRRFAFPVVGATVAMAAVAVHRQYVAGERVRAAALGAMLLAILTAAVPAAELGRWGVYGPNLEGAHVAFGKALAHSDVPEEERTIALGDAGAISYFSGWRVYDFAGLNAPEVAHGLSPTHYLLTRRPSVILLYSEDGRTLRASQRGLDAGALEPLYRSVGAFTWRPDYHLLVWVRRDLPRSAQREVRDITQRVGWTSRRGATPPSTGAFVSSVLARLP